jgi:L-fuconate dehydratase
VCLFLSAYILIWSDTFYETYSYTLSFLVQYRERHKKCSLAPLVIGRSLESFTSDMCAFWRQITGDSQLRWIGPDKGAMHLAIAAVVNAVWDLWAKVEGKPLWKLLTDITPEQLVSCIDFRSITDALTPDETLDLLRRQNAGKARREEEMLRDGFQSYTTGAGWAGYSDDKNTPVVPRGAGEWLASLQREQIIDRNL